MLLSVLMVLTAAAQGFNPDSPAEPGTQYRIKVQASPKEAGTVSGGGWYVSGKKATLKSSPTSAAWRFVNWTDNEGTVVSTQSTFTYSDINANKTLTANYEQQQVSMVTLSHDPSTGNFKATLSGAGTYAVGAKIRVRANNVSDWTLVNWTRKDNGEVMSTTNEFDYVTTEEDVEFVAHYRFTPGSSPAEPNETKAKHKVTLKANPSQGGSVSNSTPFWVREGEQYWINASNRTDWKFVGWTLEDGTPLSANSYIGLTMGTRDMVIIANFEFSPGNPSNPGSDCKKRFTLYGQTARAFKGESVLYPLYLENTSAAKELSLTLALPEGITANPDGVQLTSRTSAYSVKASQEGQDFTLSLTGGTQISGNNGAVVLVPLQIGAAVKDSIYSLSIKESSLTLADGTQPAMTSRSGSLQVSTPEEGDLQAQFTVDRYMNRAQFINTSSEGCKTFIWDFGDGTTSNERNPMHIYQSPGTYNVKLTAKGIVKTDISEQSIIVNPASTWAAEGDYTLDRKAVGVRNFTSLHEAISLLSQCTPRGTIEVAVPAGEAYPMDATQADSLNLLKTFTQKLIQTGATLKFTSAASDSSSSIAINTTPEAESLCSAMAFIRLLILDNVQVTLNGADVHPQALLKDSEEMVCSGKATGEVTLNGLSSSPSVSVRWNASIEAGSKLTDFVANGTGNIPSMVINSTATAIQRVTYNIEYLLDGVLMCTTQHVIGVRPLLRNAVLTCNSPADGSEINFGNQLVSWTGLGSLASGGYTFYWKRTDIDAEWSERECTTNSIYLQCVPGASYAWKVKAYGACDEKESAIFNFTVKRQADLAVTEFVVPEAVNALRTFTITAKVKNVGNGTTLRYSWTDALYYSQSADGVGTATRLTAVTHRGALEPGGTYDLTFTIKAPEASMGQVYYYLKTDDSNEETESDEQNNLAVSAAVSIAESYVQADDYEALKVLFNTLTGSSWRQKWQVNTPAINSTAWPGVTFNNDGRVLAINLSGNNVAGELPTEGFALPLLTSLNMSGNRVRGNLPAFVKELPALTTLDMSACALTELAGPLPATIKNLSLANQNDFRPLSYFTRQEWEMATYIENVETGSIISYNHALRNFTAHPTLSLYSKSDTYLGALTYNNGRYMLKLNGDYRLASGTEVYVRVAEGTAKNNRLRGTLSWKKGDANVDGMVDVLDARHTLNRILSWQTGSFNYLAANTYDTDDIINVQDVVATVNMFITDEASEGAKHVKARTASESVTPQGTLQIEANGLWLDAEKPVGGIDITLQGVKQSQVGLRMSHNRYQMFTHQMGDRLRVVIISPSGDEIAAGKNQLLKLSVAGAEIVSVKAADMDALDMPLAIGDGLSTAIDGPDADDEAQTELYDIQGRKLDNTPRLPKGIYIRNGRKVVIK